MGKKLFTKKVDKSLLDAGLTVPLEKVDELTDAMGLPLMRGERADIDIIIDGIVCRAVFTHVDLTVSEREMYQIRYSAGSLAGSVLKGRYGSAEDAKREDAYIEVWSAGACCLAFKCFPSAVKVAFMKYLGPADSLFGYQKSYKLVFYKCFFSEALFDEKVDAELLTKLFRQFYIDRIRSGLPAEIGVTDDVVLQANKKSVHAFYGLILRNPFQVISQHGFFRRKVIDAKDYFVINEELFDALTTEDLEEIRNRVIKKLALYYATIMREQ